MKVRSVDMDMVVAFLLCFRPSPCLDKQEELTLGLQSEGLFPLAVLAEAGFCLLLLLPSSCG